MLNIRCALFFFNFFFLSLKNDLAFFFLIRYESEFYFILHKRRATTNISVEIRSKNEGLHEVSRVNNLENILMGHVSRHVRGHVFMGIAKCDCP